MKNRTLYSPVTHVPPPHSNREDAPRRKLVVSVLFTSASEIAEPEDISEVAFAQTDASEPDYNGVVSNFLAEFPFPVDDPSAGVRVSEGLDLGLLFAGTPGTVDDSPSDGGVVADELAPAKFLHYRGSLTAPPCQVENVVWLIRRSPLALAASQLLILASASRALSGGHGNWRSNMPVGGLRALSLLEGKKLVGGGVGGSAEVEAAAGSSSSSATSPVGSALTSEVGSGVGSTASTPSAPGSTGSMESPEEVEVYVV